MKLTHRCALALLVAASLASVFLVSRERPQGGASTAVPRVPANGTTTRIAPPDHGDDRAARDDDSARNSSGESAIAADAALSQWLGQSGYGLMESFIPLDAAANWAAAHLRTDYQSYDLTALRALADQGDSIAAFHYAMNPGVAHRDAITYFEAALVNGAYPVAAFQVALRFDSIAIERDDTAPFYERLQADPTRELAEDEQSYLLWLATAADLQDPLSQRLLRTQILPSLSDDQREALQLQVAENLRRLNNLRASRSLPPLAPIQQPEQVRDYIQERYYDRSAASFPDMQAEPSDEPQ